MKIVADLHTHTNVSDHALSSFEEMIEGARRKGHVAIAITNHGPDMEDGAHLWHFGSFRVAPKNINGVAIIAGIEANMHTDGTIDIDGKYASFLDYIIASIHGDIFDSKDYDTITKAYEAVLKNPIVNALGHCGNAGYKFDYEYIISQCNQYKKIVEINNGSFISRPGSEKNCIEIARLCKKYSVPIALTSDSHSSFTVGDVSGSIDIAKTVDFPQELIINSSLENLDKYFKEYVGVDIFNR